MALPVARTHCFVGGEALAYAPLGELLRGEAFAPRLRALEPAWIAEVARILPELLDVGSPIDPPGPLLETWQRQRFLQALNRLVLGTAYTGSAGPIPTSSRAAGHDSSRDGVFGRVMGPQVLFFDDLQWCDGETLSWLAYLLHAAANSPLLILADSAQ